MIKSFEQEINALLTELIDYFLNSKEFFSQVISYNLSHRSILPINLKLLDPYYQEINQKEDSCINFRTKKDIIYNALLKYIEKNPARVSLITSNSFISTLFKNNLNIIRREFNRSNKFFFNDKVTNMLFNLKTDFLNNNIKNLKLLLNFQLV
jgi:hypothetical protein